MTGPIGDPYKSLEDDPEPPKPIREPGYRPVLASIDISPPPVGTEETPREDELTDEIQQTLVTLRMIGVPLSEDDMKRFIAMALDPRPYRPQEAYTMQLPPLMKNFLSKLVKALSLRNDEMQNAQVQRNIVLLIARHLPELIDMLDKAKEEAIRQRMEF